MRYAVVSDIHANADAFLAVLEYLKSENITRIVCLGDIVGYGPEPNVCVDLVRNHCELSLMGNHDHAALGLTDIYYFNQYAKDAIQWTRRNLNQDHKAYLESMPFTYEWGETLFVHSTPRDPEKWYYIFSEQDARLNLKSVLHRLIFIGHSHIPIVFSENKGSVAETSLKLDLKSDRYIVNVGSVGQPRDGDPRACFTVVDEADNSLSFVRLEYPVQETYQKILDNSLPSFLAMRLLAGQ